MGQYTNREKKILIWMTLGGMIALSGIAAPYFSNHINILVKVLMFYFPITVTLIVVLKHIYASLNEEENKTMQSYGPFFIYHAKNKYGEHDPIIAFGPHKINNPDEFHIPEIKAILRIGDIGKNAKYLFMSLDTKGYMLKAQYSPTPQTIREEFGERYMPRPNGIYSKA